MTILDYEPGEETAWLLWAACAEPGSPNMFPSDLNRQAVRAAKDFCHGCPVRSECLAAAMANGERYGIWGGLDATERDGVRRRQVRRKNRLMSDTEALDRASERLDSAA